MLADMATEINAAERYINPYLINNNKSVTTDSAMAKYFSSELAVKISSQAVQIFGGYGFVKDFLLKNFGEIQNFTIGEGTYKYKN